MAALENTTGEFALTTEAQRSLVLRLLHACTVLVWVFAHFECS
jgi:hypothetical protein